MGEWPEERRACEWHEGFEGPVVSATFNGHNRHGAHECTTQGRVVEADPGHAFAFECSKQISGVEDRRGRNRETMSRTLER